MNSLNCLGNLISYKKEVDIDNKSNNYMKITGIINNIFRLQKTSKKTRQKLYNTLALTALLYGSANWTKRPRNNNSSRDDIYEKNSRTHLDRIYSKHRDCKRTKYNTSFFLKKRRQEYRRNWLQHINRMSRYRLPRKIKNYGPSGRRNQWRS